MSAVNRLRKSVTAALSRGGKVAFEKLGAAFNRADELGGEARDSIVEWADKSQTAAKAKHAVERVRERAAAVRAKSAPAPAQSPEERWQPEPPPSLGDPSIPVQIFGDASCPWTGRAQRLLEDRQIEFQLIDLDDPENGTLPSQLVAETAQNTVPYIFVRGEFVGGYNALSELERLGQLELRVLSEKEREQRAGRIKIEVAKRPTTDEVAPGESSRTVDESPVDPS